MLETWAVLPLSFQYAPCPLAFFVPITGRANLALIARFNFPASLRNEKGLLSESLLMCLRLLHRQLSLWSQKTTTYTLCLYVHEGKLVAILKDWKLFLMGNIESAELETQLCGSDGDIISSVSQCSLSTHCVQGIHDARLCREITRRRSAQVLEWLFCCCSLLTLLGI